MAVMALRRRMDREVARADRVDGREMRITGLPGTLSETNMDTAELTRSTR
jgi:hypothetical protein